MKLLDWLMTLLVQYLSPPVALAVLAVGAILVFMLVVVPLVHLALHYA